MMGCKNGTNLLDRVDKEMKWTFAVSLVIHLLMNIPMIILGKLFNDFLIN